MKTLRMPLGLLLAGLVMMAPLGGVLAASNEAVLIEGGEPRASLVVPAALLEIDASARRLPQDDRLATYFLADFPDYLEKMTGARIAVGVEVEEGSLPIVLRVKEEGEEWGVSSPYGCAYRITVTPEGIEVAGETVSGISNGLYYLLGHWGVRWYGPEEFNEVVPTHERIALPVGVIESAPDFYTRRIWGSHHWMARNRMVTPHVPGGHAFHRFMAGAEPRGSEPLHIRRPELYPIVDGEVSRHNINASSEEAYQRIVEGIRNHINRQIERGDRVILGSSFSPDDGFWQDHRPESLGVIGTRVDPFYHIQDTTDVLVKLGNRLAEDIRDEFPEAKLGFYVYANHQTVPTVEVDPMILPIVAPISYSRFHSIGNPISPTSMMLANTINEWVELVPNIGFYLYNFNLADMAMPFSRVEAFRRDIPNLHRLGFRHGDIESHDNWHTMIPGNWIFANLFWDVDSDVDALLDEFYPSYYGSAAEAMRAYDELVANAYETTHAYTGNLFSMPVIFPSERRTEMARLLDQAEQAAGGDELILKRIGPARYAFQSLQIAMRAMDALENLEFAEAAKASDAFIENFEAASEEYPSFFFRLQRNYWNAFHARSFADAGRLVEEGELLASFPDEVAAYIDFSSIGEELALYAPEQSKDSWMSLKTKSSPLGNQGFPLFRGHIWYAHDLEVPAFELKDGEGLFLWFGGNDSNTKVYIDGAEAGEFSTVNFRPAEIQVTPYVKPGETHHIVVGVDNRPVYELGTGGIMRPVVLYKRPLREDEDAVEAVAPRYDRARGEGPLFTDE